MATIKTGAGGGVGVVTITSTVLLSAAITHGRPASFQITLSAGLSTENIPITGVKTTDIVLLTPLNAAAAALTQAYAVPTANNVSINSGGTSAGTEQFAVLILPQPLNFGS